MEQIMRFPTDVELNKNIRFNYLKAGNRKGIKRTIDIYNKSSSIMHKIYLDETWFDSHNATHIIWSDITTKFFASGP